MELYRSKEDVGHQRDMSDTYPDVVEALHGQFVNWLNAIETPARYLDPRGQL